MKSAVVHLGARISERKWPLWTWLRARQRQGLSRLSGCSRRSECISWPSFGNRYVCAKCESCSAGVPSQGIPLVVGGPGDRCVAQVDSEG